MLSQWHELGGRRLPMEPSTKHPLPVRVRLPSDDQFPQEDVAFRKRPKTDSQGLSSQEVAFRKRWEKTEVGSLVSSHPAEHLAERFEGSSAVGAQDLPPPLLVAPSAELVVTAMTARPGTRLHK